MRLDGRAIGIFIVTIILLIVPIVFLVKILSFNDITSTKCNHELTIVLATDNGFVEPTAVLMQSVKLSTPQSKTFIIIGDEVSTANRTKLQQMQDKNNSIIWIDLQQEKYQKFLQQVTEFKTQWHRLVALRLVYAEMLQDIKIHGKNIEKFIHLDSDMYVLKDLSELWNLEFDENKLFIAANYSFVAQQYADHFPNIRYVHPHMCGGVVVWNVKRIIEKFQEAGRNIFLYDGFKHNQQALLCTHEATHMLVNKVSKLLAKETNLPKNFLIATKNIQEKVFRYIDSTNELKILIKAFPETFNDKILNRAFGFFIYNNAIDPESEYIKPGGNWKFDTSKSYATEEILFNPYAQLIDFSWDFLTKFTMPDTLLNEDSKKDCELILSTVLKYKAIQEELKYYINNMKILHFCSKPKPWDCEALDLIKSNPKENYLYHVYHQILNTTPFYKSNAQIKISNKEYAAIVEKLITSIRNRIYKKNPILVTK